MVGQTLLNYHILEKLGAGGMGEVYRAQDTKLGRDVAIKILPPEFARDPERLARFEREARVLASLNHPNIAAIYGLDQANGVHFLVLEYVPGEILRGPIELDEALRLAAQIVEAFEAAHEKGFVHRDLKPANVKVTPEGKIKLLDFGLAKALADEQHSGDPSRSPTMSLAATRAGTLLGTAAYMSPEQARGRPIDKRADIWAFGCVLYEVLAGRQTFSGESITDVLAAVVRAEPDWSALPAGAPLRLLRRCLEKDPQKRLRDIGDARILLDEPPPEVPRPPAPGPRPPAPDPRRHAPWAVAGLLAVVAGIALWAPWRRPPAPPPLKRFVVTLPSTDSFAFTATPVLALSPDGKRLVYAAARAGQSQLFVRPMDQFEATPIAGTEGAFGPFFSPDGEWVGFIAGGKLKKVSLSGGAPLVVCDVTTLRGASWGPDDNIILNLGAAGGLHRVSAAGGAPQPITTPDAKKGETAHRWPEILPGGKAVVFSVQAGAGYQIAARRLDAGEHKLLPEAGTYPRYVPAGDGGPGYLVFARAGSLMAAPFDPVRLEFTGKAFLIAQGVMMSTGGIAHYSAARDSSLAYVSGSVTSREAEMVWVDRQGKVEPASRNRRAYVTPSVSPDGRRLAVSLATGDLFDVWVQDLARDTLTRLTLEGGMSGSPIWTPDGKRVTYWSSREGPPNLYWRAADGSGPEERLTTSNSSQLANSWSPDGKALVFDQAGEGTGRDLMVLPMEKERKPRPFLQTKFDERSGRFSPDGRWLAYVANDSGRSEIFVQPFPGPGGKWQVSTDGGDEPVWARSGRELFYRNGDKLMAVDVSTAPTFSAGAPRLLFEGRYVTLTGRTTYDVSPDGRRFVMVRPVESVSGQTQIHVVLNWLEARK